MELENYIYLFAIIIFLRYFGIIYNTLLTISEKQKLRAIFLAISLVVIIALDFILIPKYQIYGALYALIIGHIVLYSLAMITAKIEFKTLFLIKG